MNTWLIIAVIHTTYAVVKLKSEKNSGLNGIRTYDLCDTGARLNQLNYQAIRGLVMLWVRNTSVYGSSGFQAKENIWYNETACQVVLLLFFFNALSKETLQNYASAVFDLLYPVGYKLCPVGIHLYLWAFAFESWSNSFALHRLCIAKALWTWSDLLHCFRHWRMKVSLSENNRERRTLRKESSTEVYQI